MELLRAEIERKKTGKRWVRQSEVSEARRSELRAKRVKVEEEEEKEDVVTEVKRKEDELALDGAYGIKNRFLKEDDSENDEDEEEEDDDVFGSLRRWIKRKLGEWRDRLDRRPEREKSTAVGRVDTKTFQQCKDYIRPLLKLCKRKELDVTMAESLSKIFDFCDAGEFVKAHDAYILIAIGNAAWPIGVTSVGIHTRTAREAVEQKNVAHVMNNEMQRKYLTSVKRLLRFAQDSRDDVPPSKKVL